MRRAVAVAAGALGLLLVGAGPAAAVCEPSGAFDVATHEEIPGAIVVWDSVGNLTESVDDGVTWGGTDRLPLGSARSADEVCLGDGRCLRIREDRLGVEERDGGGWSTVWEYPPDHVQFLERQLPGPCGEGHGSLGLSAMIEAPAGSAHAALLAAGADGLHSLDGDRWQAGLLGPTASLDAPASEIYLVPETSAIVLGVVVIGLWLSMWRGGGDARAQAIVMVITSAAGVAWVVLPALGSRSFGLVLVVGLLAGVGLWLTSKRLHIDVAEIVVGAIWGVGIAFALRTVITSHEAEVFALTIGGISLLLLGGSWWAGRDRAAERGPKATWIPVVAGGLVALGAYWLWAGSVIVSKPLADAVASAAGLGVLAWALAVGPPRRASS